jgi:hypothetical protein
MKKMALLRLERVLIEFRTDAQDIIARISIFSMQDVDRLLLSREKRYCGEVVRAAVFAAQK